jgi:hypothetical protein
MENPTFRSRLGELLQKSRKAMRLYSGVGSNSSGRAHNLANQYSELQATEWQQVNAELVRMLGTALGHPQARRITQEVFAIRDRLLHEVENEELQLGEKQRELVAASERGDFVRAAVLSRELVVLKARMQASQAAHHELQQVIERSNVVEQPIELTAERVVPEPEVMRAKVIPIRKRSAS